MGLGGQAEFQSPVNGVSKLPNLRLCLTALHCYRVLEITAVLHLESLRTFKREAFSLKLTITAHGQFNVFSKAVIKRQVIVAHNYPVAIAVVVYLHIKNYLVFIVVYFHCVFCSESYFSRIRRTRALRF